MYPTYWQNPTSSCITLSQTSQRMTIACSKQWLSAPPVVSTDAAGVRESIEDGMTGMLVPFGKPEDFAGVVRSLLRDDDKRDQLSIAARRSVEERFSMAQVCRSYNVLYKKVTGQ